MSSLRLLSRIDTIHHSVLLANGEILGVNIVARISEKLGG
jgi:hypothetical protein